MSLLRDLARIRRGEDISPRIIEPTRGYEVEAPHPALSVPCPRCEADEGMSCVAVQAERRGGDPSFRPVGPHLARVRAWRGGGR